MKPVGTLSRFGFDPVRLRYSLRTALGSCLALLVAWLLGLEHPQWAAMTVFAASQPTRNMLVEKSFFRAAGTLVGTVAGVLLVLVADGQAVILVLGLALWIGLCTWAGNVLRGFVAYGTILAGYTAAMVALLDTAHPDHIFALGTDRLLTVLTGVATALAVGLLLAPRNAEDAIVSRVRHLSARLLHLMAARLRGAGTGGLDDQRTILREMAALDEGLDPHGAGSLRSRRSARTLRALIAAQVSTLLWLRISETIPVVEGVSEALAEAADALAAAAPGGEVVQALERAADRAAGNPALHEVILRWEGAMQDRLGVSDGETKRPRVDHPVVLHRDWVGARHATIRATGLMLLLGAIWVLTGWAAGPYLLLGTAVMVTLFSTWENPARIMTAILIGQIFGGIAALACRWLVWPFASSEAELIVMMMPFILSGVLPLSHRRTMAGATDYCLILLLLLQPSYPLTGRVTDSLAMTAAVIAAPLIALLGFRLVFPADARRRMTVLIGMMVRELQDLARALDAAKHHQLWQARLYHRLLRLVRWSEKAGDGHPDVEEGGLAVYALGLTVLHLQRLRREEALPPGLIRAINAVLRRMGRIATQPEPVVRTLALAAARLARSGRPESRLVRSAAEALSRNLRFFSRSERGT